MPTDSSPPGTPGSGAASPATSWCRAPQRSGRCAGWPTYGAACARWATGSMTPAGPPVRTWCSSCTTRSSCTHPPPWPMRSPRRCGSPPREPAACCSATSRSTSPSTSRWPTATPRPSNASPPPPPPLALVADSSIPAARARPSLPLTAQFLPPPSGVSIAVVEALQKGPERAGVAATEPVDEVLLEGHFQAGSSGLNELDTSGEQLDGHACSLLGPLHVAPPRHPGEEM